MDDVDAGERAPHPARARRRRAGGAAAPPTARAPPPRAARRPRASRTRHGPRRRPRRARPRASTVCSTGPPAVECADEARPSCHGGHGPQAPRRRLTACARRGAPPTTVASAPISQNGVVSCSLRNDAGDDRHDQRRLHRRRQPLARRCRPRAIACLRARPSSRHAEPRKPRTRSSRAPRLGEHVQIGVVDVRASRARSGCCARRPAPRRRSAPGPTPVTGRSAAIRSAADHSAWRAVTFLSAMLPFCSRRSCSSGARTRRRARRRSASRRGRAATPRDRDAARDDAPRPRARRAPPARRATASPSSRRAAARSRTPTAAGGAAR